MKIKILFSAILIFLGLTPSVVAKNLYVNNSGTPACSDATARLSNDADNPWCTIGRAMWGDALRTNSNTSEAAQAGDIVIVSPGTYHQTQGTGTRWTPALKSLNSGTVGNPITYKAEYPAVIATPIQRTVITTDTAANHESVIGTESQEYIILDGFYIDEANVDMRGTGVNLADETWVTHAFNSNNITIQNFVIVSRDVYELDVGFIHSVNHAAIFVQDSDTITIKNNKLYGGEGIHHNSSAIMTYSVHDSTFEHNEIYLWYGGIHLKGETSDASCANTVRFNMIYNTKVGVDIGAHAGTCGDSNIYQNIIRDSATTWGEYNAAAISFTSYGANSPSGINFYNNTIHGIISIEAGAVNTSGQLGNNIEITNNIISDNSTAVGNPYQDGVSGYTFDYNFYNDNTNHGKINGENINFATWQMAYSQDSNGFNNTDPQFADEANNDFRLATGSPALTASSTSGPVGAYITGDEILGISLDVSTLLQAPLLRAPGGTIYRKADGTWLTN